MIINLSPYAATAVAQQQQANALFVKLGKYQTELTAWVWGNLDGSKPGLPTPQQAFDAYGPNAADLLKLNAAYAALYQVYLGQALPSPIPAGWTATADMTPPDANGVQRELGTVTVTAPAK